MESKIFLHSLLPSTYLLNMASTTLSRLNTVLNGLQKNSGVARLNETDTWRRNISIFRRQVDAIRPRRRLGLVWICRDGWDGVQGWNGCGSRHEQRRISEVFLRLGTSPLLLLVVWTAGVNLQPCCWAAGRIPGQLHRRSRYDWSRSVTITLGCP